MEKYFVKSVEILTSEYKQKVTTSSFLLADAAAADVQ